MAASTGIPACTAIGCWPACCDASPRPRSPPKSLDVFDRRLTPETIAGERRYLAAPTARGFERPYGWGWLLKLAAELADLPERRWSHALAPLAEDFALRFHKFLPLASYPVRVGTHFNTAFAVRLAADYAEAMGDDTFLTLLRATAERWYGRDSDCPAWGEPSGDDFLSSALVEAECMRRILPLDEFQVWFGAFLPGLAHGLPRSLFIPAQATDRSDGKIAHLDGLNLSRAWCFRALAQALPDADGRRVILHDAADLHLETALPHVDERLHGRTLAGQLRASGATGLNRRGRGRAWFYSHSRPSRKTYGRIPFTSP